MIFVDVETTGLNPEKNAIADIGAVYLTKPEDQSLFIPSGEIYLQPRVPNDAEIDAKALEINGYTIDELRNPVRIIPEKAIKEFIAWAENIHDRTLAGENPRFDLDFLRTTAVRYNAEFHFGYRTIDLHTICYCHHLKSGKKIPIENGRTAITLDKTLDYVGLPPEQKPHRGLRGAKLEAEAFSRLIFGKSLFPEYKEFKVPEYLL